MAHSKSEIVQGTLDLMALKTLDGTAQMHGYSVSRRSEQVSDKALRINRGTVSLSARVLLPGAEK